MATTYYSVYKQAYEPYATGNTGVPAPAAPTVTTDPGARTLTLTLAPGTSADDYEIEFFGSPPAPAGPTVTADPAARTLTLTLAPGTTIDDYEIEY